MPGSRLTYINKLVLAPMVRVGTLPTRLLALDYGADIVYCEELIDWKLLRSRRIKNDILNTVDYVDESDGTVIFRTCAKEQDKVVLQIGTCSAERALKVAKLVENDIAGIDVNMGCPKEFSIKGGMGAALLEEPEKVKEILTTLVNGVNIPVTCKIRLLPTLEETIKFCRMVEECGVAAIAIHGRTRVERPQHANRNKTIYDVAQALTIPVIANGGSKEVECYEDIWRFKKATGASSVMLARAAEWNLSIFRPEGKLPIDEVICAHLRYAVVYDSVPSNTKYCIQNILRELQETPRGRKFLETQTLEQICDIWGLGDFCRKTQEEQRLMKLQLGSISPPIQPRVKRVRLSSPDVHERECQFLRNLFLDKDLPKTKLLVWSRRVNSKQPVYFTEQHDKLFRSIVTVDGKKYTSSYWEKNKRNAEQGAALVCLCTLGVVEESEFIKNGSLKPSSVAGNGTGSEDVKSVPELCEVTAINNNNLKENEEKLVSEIHIDKSCKR